MGQAKQRGSFAHRRTAAIVRRAPSAIAAVRQITVPIAFSKSPMICCVPHKLVPIPSQELP